MGASMHQVQAQLSAAQIDRERVEGEAAKATSKSVSMETRLAEFERLEARLLETKDPRGAHEAAAQSRWQTELQEATSSVHQLEEHARAAADRLKQTLDVAASLGRPQRWKQ